MDPRLLVVIEDYLRAHGMNAPPSLITSDPVAAPGSTIDDLLSALGLAANVGDSTDNADAQTGHAGRELKTTDALTKFPANEEDSAVKLAGVGQEAQMAQMAPQLTAGIAGGIAGAVGGALQPLAQIPQQLAQVGSQLLQTGTGALAGTGAGAEFSGDTLGDDSGGGFGVRGDWAADDGDEGGGGREGTGPAAMLGPPPTPAAGTAPASAQTTPAGAPGPPPSSSAPRGGMGAVPLMPPGAVQGAGGGSEAKADTKRVVVPSVKNGAPVQGRLTTPPPNPTVTKRVEGKPVTSRRVVVPGRNGDEGHDLQR